MDLQIDKDKKIIKQKLLFKMTLEMFLEEKA